VPVPEDTCITRVIARSSDNGATWSTPVEVADPYPAPEARHSNAPPPCSSMATNGQGTWLAVWAQYPPDDGSCPSDPGFELAAARSPDDGLTCSAPAVAAAADRPCGQTTGICNYHTYCASHTLYSVDGAWVLIWSEPCTVSAEEWDHCLVVASRDDGQTWTTPAAFSVHAFDWDYFPRSPRSPLQLIEPTAGYWCLFWRGPFRTLTSLCAALPSSRLLSVVTSGLPGRHPRRS
jgi:hypothetical protein